MAKSERQRKDPTGDRVRVNPARIAGLDLGNRARLRIIASVAGTVFIHLIAILALPDSFWPPVVVEPRVESQLEIVLEEPEEPEEQFIMTNPDVPSNPPDETDFFSDRDQQAAQETETDEGDRSLPEVEGEEPEPTQNIVADENVEPTEEWIEYFEHGWETDPEMSALPERLIPGFEPVESDEGLEVPVTEEEAPDLEEDPVIGVELGAGEEEESLEMVDAGEREAEPVVPRPRPRLPQTSHNLVGERQGAAPRTGPIAVDANFSEYGDYLSRMLDVIVRQWYFLAWESLPAGETGTVVSVSFLVGADGRIRDLEVVETSAGLIATLICQDAVEARQPYGEWTPEMREVLGEEQTVRIRFHYR
ncbi:MAG TPA: hypothetical protein VK041_06705 [Opitutales bacterium]|nr:hypothetical protein [Opitutales bacterium]